MLRISYHSYAGMHFDNSYCTIMGTGNLKGALQFGEALGSDEEVLKRQLAESTEIPFTEADGYAWRNCDFEKVDRSIQN